MTEPRWPDDVPPPWAPLYELGKNCLDELNQTARANPPTSRLEHELCECLRSQALAIGLLSQELLRLREHGTHWIPED